MRPYLVLFIALIGISVAAPLVRLSHADPLAIAVWRLGFSLVIIAGFLIQSGTWRQWLTLTRPDLGVALGAGAVLAVHFWSWNASVGMTTVAASVVLVNIQPAVVVLLSVVWLSERPSRKQLAGIAVAMLGAVIVAAPDLSTGGGAHGTRALIGDGLAVLGGVAGAIYYTAGRRLRRTLDLWAYVGLVYGACFVTLLLFAAIFRVRVAPQPPRELIIFVALAVGPMMLGHTGLNWALRYLPAYVVNLTTLGEPVGATMLAAAIPGIGEIPSVITLVGGAVLLAGVVVAAG